MNPNLTTADSSLWRIIKQDVHKRRYVSNIELKNAVRNAFMIVTPQTLRKMSRPGVASILHRSWKSTCGCF
ncbi:hypothetical protein ANN_11059 [Periplaneta americana]|uniref:Uncharacterized protein n=1 Tax=Periplaneta americana TaxID=6978 RepID=A0ABQ8T3Z8_PERAM|nr:hypothetical protein ANN_11059 [Periplaneta americana]